jgi:diguanylate cyclase (GGDEF)-like protein
MNAISRSLLQSLSDSVTDAMDLGSLDGSDRYYALAFAALRGAIIRFEACVNAQQALSLLQEASVLLLPQGRCGVMRRQQDGCLELADGLPDLGAKLLPEESEHAIESGWIAMAIKQGVCQIEWQRETWILAKLASPRFVHGVAIWVRPEIPKCLQQPLCAMADLAALALDRVMEAAACSAQFESDAVNQRFEASAPQAVASIDPLTGLAQRSQFVKSLRQALEKTSGGQSVGVMLLDIDGFHRVNKELGCSVGDQVLRSFAHRLESVFHSHHVIHDLGIVCSDVCIARTGADELGIAVAHLPVPERLRYAADEVQTHLSEGFFQGSQRLYLSTSIGIAAASPLTEAMSAESLLRRADSALKRAKSLGRNRSVLYDPLWGESGAIHLRTESLLHEALQHSLFQLHFQPLFRVVDLKLVGAEVLLRLNTSDGVPVSPSSFIPVAESTGQIVEISEWVLDNLCQQVSEWDRRGCSSIPFSINLSAIEFGQDDLPRRLNKILAQHHIRPSRFHLEVTETAIARNEAQALANIESLRSVGFEVWLDDFGTGYSSLKSLKTLPVSGIKIDREFVADLDEHASTAVIAQGIIEVARNLGYPVVAEGIENSAQLEFLRTRCCDIGQGFYLGRPASAQDFEQHYMAT